MKFIKDIIFGNALTKLTNVMEEEIRAQGSGNPGGYIGGAGFDYLPKARQEELSRKIPKWIETVRTRSPFEVTIEMLKNYEVSRQLNRPDRAAAQYRLLHVLASEGLAVILNNPSNNTEASPPRSDPVRAPIQIQDAGEGN